MVWAKTDNFSAAGQKLEFFCVLKIQNYTDFHPKTLKTHQQFPLEPDLIELKVN